MVIIRGEEKKKRSIGLRIASYLIGLVFFCLFTYGCYWVVKHISYSLFYEDMVEQTITEMVKKGSLIQP